MTNQPHSNADAQVSTNVSPEAPQSLSEAEQTVALTAQIQRVEQAFQIPGANPLTELAELDQLYAAAGANASALVGETARRLFSEKAVFDNLHFHSSLLSGGSKFYGDVLRRMGDLADKEPALAEAAALPVQIRLVEHGRRAAEDARQKGQADQVQRYIKMMEANVVRVEAQLRDRLAYNDSLALGQLAKVRYEESMHAYNQKDFAVAMQVGDESAELCERAGDSYGAMAARGNSSGLCRYELARSLGSDHPDYQRLLAEGRPVLEADLQMAQAQVGVQKDAPMERQKYERVTMNDAAHLMHIADLQKDLALARRMLAVLEGNEVYRQAVQTAQSWTQPYAQIMARLEQAAKQQ